MNRAALLTIAGAAAALAACSPELAPVAPPASEDSAVVLMPVAADPTISFSVQFAVGSQDDPPGKEGLAFLTGEMLADAATEARSLDAILEALYPLAASYGMRVDRERSTLTGRVHRDNLDAYLELFTDAFLHPKFEATDFERVQSDAINDIENTLRYSSDEELGKATLNEFVFRGTRYAHPSEGTVAGLRSITLDDVRTFYRQHYTAGNVLLGVGGGFDEALVTRLRAALRQLPAGEPAAPPTIEPAAIDGRSVTLIDKPGADASISFGFPVNVHRGERDFYALWIANSWLGEHRNSASRLFNVIREARGLNYGDYSYIEAFPEGGERSMPPVNVPRRQQLFEVWIRTLPNPQAPFALRAALRELTLLVDNGLTGEQFELTRAFLKKYSLHYAETTSARLGYAMDDRFYGIDGAGHLARFRQMMDELTLADVNAAIKRHLQYANLKIAIVTGDATNLRALLASDAPTPISYDSPKPDAILAEDREIAALRLGLTGERIEFVPVMSAFERLCGAGLFQTELLAGRETHERFAQPPSFGFFALGRLDPTDIRTPVRRREPLEGRPGLGVGPQRLLEMRRQRPLLALRRNAAARRGWSRLACLGQQAACLHLRVAAAIDRRPAAVRRARRELPHVAIVVEALHEAVDPAEAQRLLHGGFVVDVRLARVQLVKHEPDLGRGPMVLSQPGAPRGARSHRERLQRRRRHR